MSHNTMGAFFSGTDDGDDRGAIGFSGVMGQLNKEEPATIWRFNYMDRKFEAKLENIFEVPQREAVDVPNEWLDQVKVQTYQARSYGLGSQTGHTGSAGRGSHTNFSEHVGSKKEEGRDSSKKAQPSVSQAKGSGDAQRELELSGEFWEQTAGKDFVGIYQGRPITADEAEEILAQAERTFVMNASDEEEDPVGATVSGAMSHERFDELMINRGARVASAFCEISDMMVDLEGEDDLLFQSAIEMVGMMDEAARTKMFREVYSLLPEDEKMKIAQNGF